MYQAIHFDYKDSSIYIKDDTKSDFIKMPYKPVVYRLDNNGKDITIDDKKVSKVILNNIEERKSLSPEIFYEIDLDPVTDTLTTIYRDNDDVPVHNIMYFDIETEILGDLTGQYIEEAKANITSISYYFNGKYTCLIVSKELDNSCNDNKEIICFSEESDLLKFFINKLSELKITIIVGWNSEHFDVPYLYFRCVRLLGSAEAKRLSPINIIKKRKEFNEKSKELIHTITFAGLNHFDMMLLFQDGKFQSKQEESYSLNAIGEKYVKLGKVEYTGNLNDLYRDDKKKFIDYNIRDVEIMVKLEEVKKFIELSLIFCHICHVGYDNIYYATMLNEGAMLNFLRKKNIISNNKPTTYNESLRIGIEEKYAGGHTKPPVPGVYNWISDLDFTSLYPSIIMNLNMGNDTLIGTITNREKYDYKLSMSDLYAMDPDSILSFEKVNFNRKKEATDIKVKDLINLIIKRDVIISANGSIFRKDKRSAAASILEAWFNKRVEYKKLMKEEYKKGNKEKGDFYDKRQYSFKILLNGLSGTYAISSWRYTDGHFMVSKAITLTGNRLIIDSYKHVNSLLNKELNTDKDYIITSDTDSMFIHFEDLIKWRFNNIDMKDDKVVISKLLDITKEFQGKTVPFLNKLSKDIFRVDNKNFELKQEVIIKTGLFTAMRRYAMRVVNKEGIDVSDTVIMGLDIIKSNFPKKYREFGKFFIDTVLNGVDINKLSADIRAFKKECDETDFLNIIKPSGLGKLNEYVERSWSTDTKHTIVKKQCPINTKSAINYNDFLKNNRLDKKHNSIVKKEKIYYCYLKKNPQHLDVIAWKKDSPEEITDFIKKYIDRDKMFDTIISSKLKLIYDDLKWSYPNLSENYNYSLF